MTMGRKRTTAANAQKLPENVIVDILFKLPARSLSRFRLLSRKYLSLLQSPDFITAHARDSCLNRAGVLVLAESISGKKEALFLPPVIPPDNNSNGTSIEPVKKNGFSDFPLPFLKGYSEFGEEPKLRYAGSFNGLVCLIHHRWGEYWVLWNPATSQFSFAPPPILPQRDCFCNGARPHRVIAGFGYDSAVRDYKSVRVSWWTEDGGGVQVEVLSWAKRSWTEIQDRSLDTILTVKRQGSWSFQNLPVATSNGGVYWMDTGTGMVLCFKLHDEKLEWISTPDDAAAAAAASWSVLRTINGSPCIPEAIWRVNGESLFLLYVNCIACDSTGAARLKLPFHVISRAFEFAETLVPIPGS
ncbi:unnamed protein product [Linum tenue]|uniref:F-box domain-containing protein n=1 Tax=Linum tenue TaxID=586396 RepID=A0AAV0IG18_9ROSI|nr:unnamed protein product [Linum tenue]